MATLQLISKFKKNNDLLLSPRDIRENYLFGIPLNQSSIPFKDSDIEFYIRAATKEVEHYLTLRLIRQQYTESLTFSWERWKSWGFIKTTYPVVCPIDLKGFFNKVQQAHYPKEWLTTKTQSDDDGYHRMMYMVPTSNAVTYTNSIVFAGYLPQLGYVGFGTIPYYWNAIYTTGFIEVPKDILNVIGKLTAINLLNIAGNLVLGRAGVQSQSISIDGLSQSMSSANYGKQIQLYMQELERQLKLMKSYYTGFNIGSL